jgi:hypothetical protein
MFRPPHGDPLSFDVLAASSFPAGHRLVPNSSAQVMVEVRGRQTPGRQGERTELFSGFVACPPALLAPELRPTPCRLLTALSPLPYAVTPTILEPVSSPNIPFQAQTLPRAPSKVFWHSYSLLLFRLLSSNSAMRRPSLSLLAILVSLVPAYALAPAHDSRPAHELVRRAPTCPPEAIGPFWPAWLSTTVQTPAASLGLKMT